MQHNIIHKENLRGDNNLPDHITVTSFDKETLKMIAKRKTMNIRPYKAGFYFFCIFTIINIVATFLVSIWLLVGVGSGSIGCYLTYSMIRFLNKLDW